MLRSFNIDQVVQSSLLQSRSWQKAGLTMVAQSPRDPKADQAPRDTSFVIIILLLIIKTVLFILKLIIFLVFILLIINKK
jgi:hypothetical protein